MDLLDREDSALVDADLGEDRRVSEIRVGVGAKRHLARPYQGMDRLK